MSPPKDKLIIRGLTAKCRLGVTEEERAAPQHVVIDLELAIDAAKAAQGDNVADTVDYAALAAAVLQLASQRPVRLLETLTESIARLAIERFYVKQATVRVTKRALPGIDGATVEITRTSRF